MKLRKFMIVMVSGFGETKTVEYDETLGLSDLELFKELLGNTFLVLDNGFIVLTQHISHIAPLE